MSVAAIREAIRVRMAAIPDIGMVHAYQRYAKNMNTLRNFYESATHNQIRGWFIQRLTTEETGQVQPDSVEIIGWRIQGFMSLDDGGATDLTFDALVEAVRDKFRGDDTLGGAVSQITIPPNGSAAGVQVDDYGPALFAGVLVHMAKLRLNTVRYLST